MKTLHLSMVSISIIIAMSMTMSPSTVSSNSGSLTELYTPSPDLTKMSLILSDTFKQTSNSTKDLHLEFFDAKNSTMIKNVSFFINVTKGDKILMHDLFNTKTGFMTIKFHPGSDMGKWSVNGSLDPILGGWMSQNDTVSVTVPAFTEVGTYHIHFAVLALVYVNGLVDQNNPPTFDSWWSVDEKGNISKNNNSTTISFGISSNSIEIKDKSPLQQLKSGINAKDVKCKQGLQLIFKFEDGSPACVKPGTASKLIQRGWAIETSSLQPFIKKIDITGLQENYKVGKPISVMVNYTGSWGSTYPDVKILDSNDNSIWSNCCVPERLEPVGILSNRTFTYHVQGPNGYPVINETGTYTMIASIDNKTAGAKFVVIP